MNNEKLSPRILKSWSKPMLVDKFLEMILILSSIGFHIFYSFISSFIDLTSTSKGRLRKTKKIKRQTVNGASHSCCASI